MTDKGRAPRPWFRVEPRAVADKKAPTTADVYVYDEIGESWWGGLSPKALVDEIAALDAETLTVHINSPGGAAWDGVSIMNALRAHPARVEVVVDGLAASAASVIAMAGDRITMNRGAQMMIHDASGVAVGNAAVMEDTAAILHKLSDSLADTYAARAGGDRESWRAVMQAETWYTAEEAVEAGLADEWDGSAGEATTKTASASFDMSRFRYPGRAHAPAPLLAAAHMPPDSTEPGTPNQKEVAVSDTIKAGLRERLGVTDADATDETLLAALDEALTEQADTTPSAAAELPDGVTVIDKAVLADLRAAAEQGVAARAEQARVRREGILASAVAEGRIAPASREGFAALLVKDEDATVALLESLPKNTIPVVEVGHSDATAEANAYPAHWKR